VSAANGLAPMRLDPMTVARAFKESGMFPDLRSEAQAVVKIVAGQEVGFGPMAAMQAVQMIQGKPTFSANALAALVKKHPNYNYKATEHTAEVCRLQFYEDGEEAGVSECTMQDAQRAGLSGPSWKKYPKAMLFARALSQGVRWYAPDVTAGAAAYVPEELGAEVDAEGEVIPDETQSLPASVEMPVIDDDLAEEIAEAFRSRKMRLRDIDTVFVAAGLEPIDGATKKAVTQRIEALRTDEAEWLLNELAEPVE
jgi:hypothetical protein